MRQYTKVQVVLSITCVKQTPEHCVSNIYRAVVRLWGSVMRNAGLQMGICDAECRPFSA